MCDYYIHPLCQECFYAPYDGLRIKLPIELFIESCLEVEKEQDYLCSLQPCISACYGSGSKLQLLFCRINLKTTAQTCVGYEWD